MAVFILTYRSHSYRRAAVVPRSNWRSWALSRKTHTYIMLLPMCTWTPPQTFFTLSFILVKVQGCCMFKFKEILGYISFYHPIPALTGFYFIGRIRFLTSVAFFFFLLWGCAIRLLSFRKSSVSICPVYQSIRPGSLYFNFFFFYTAQYVDMNEEYSVFHIRTQYSRDVSNNYFKSNMCIF